jgi:hypothetical protein
MILHIIPDEKFVPFLHGLFEEARPKENLWRVVTNKPNLVFAAQSENTLAVNSSYFLSNKFKEDVSVSDCVVFHTLELSHAVAALRIPKQKPIVWRGWGFDYYGYLESNGMSLLLPETSELSRRFGKATQVPIRQLPRKILSRVLSKMAGSWLKRRFIERVNYFSCCVPDDFESLKKVLPNFSATFIPLNYYSKEDIFLRGDNLRDLSGKDILLGNSASATNNHIEAMRMLSGMGMQGRKVIVPLSYGDLKYQEQIIRAGQELLGDSFTPLTKYLTLSEYNEIVAGCGNVVMNHIRQQAIGNVSAALLRGGKVYLRAENPIYKYYTRLGAKLFLLSDELTLSNLDTPLTQVDVSRNKEIMTRIWAREFGLKQAAHLASLGIEDE